MPRLFIRPLLAALAAIFITASTAFAQGTAADFFKGKTITYIVATSPGGGYDSYARLIARYMQGYIPGAKIIIRNIPGAGHVVGTNTLYAAKPDGLTIGTFDTGLILLQLLKDKGARFDLTKMSWIGKAAADPRVLILSKFVKITDPKALFDTSKPPLKFYCAGVGTADYFDIKIAINALHLNAQLIPGFNGNEGEMSMLRQETAGSIGSESSYADYVEAGNGHFVLEIGGAPGSKLPQARDFAPNDEARQLLAILEAQSRLVRLTAGPPGIPADRLAVLRDAYMKALTDPKLLADARKMQVPIDPADGATVEKTIIRALHQSSQNVAALRRAVEKD
jgi:tripartite-type tricarboxylate transporter receptor subunit TctC